MARIKKESLLELGWRLDSISESLELAQSTLKKVKDILNAQISTTVSSPSKTDLTG